jgi:membrane protein
MLSAFIPAALRDRLSWFGQVVTLSVQLFLRNELGNHAAAIAFYFLLSIAPIVLLLLYAVNHLIQLPVLAERLPELFVALWDQLNLGNLKMLGLLPEQTQAAASGASVLTLLFASRGLLNALQSAFRVIFSGGKRGFIQSVLISLLAMPLALALIILVIVGQHVLDYLSRMALLAPLLATGLGLGGGVLVFLLVWLLVFLACYRMPLPPAKPALAALISLLCTLSFVLLKAVFGYVVSLHNYQAIYGTLGTLVFSLIWLYVVALVFLFWAQCQYAIGRVDVLGLEQLFLQQNNARERKLLGSSERLVHKYGQIHRAGTRLINAGETSQLSYFLHSGTVGMYQDARKIAELEPGQLFGEMAYLLNEPRTVDVRAETDVQLLVIPPPLLEQLMAASPALSRQIVATLAERLKRMNALQPDPG